jgi:hypothetical protein
VESWQVYRDFIDAIGAKKVASALNLSMAQVYKLQQPIEADGVRSDIDRLEQLVDVAAAHTDARPALIRARLHIDSFFRRALDRDTPQPLTDTRIAEKAGHICEEVGELLQCMKPGFDREDVSKEASEVIDAVDRLMRALNQKPCAPSNRTPLRAG